MYVRKDKSKAIVFDYLVDDRFAIKTSTESVTFDGLDPDKQYRVREINVFDESKSIKEAVYLGDFLMKVGINTGLSTQKRSVVLEVQEVALIDEN
jgi:alpha-galactosidase